MESGKEPSPKRPRVEEANGKAVVTEQPRSQPRRKPNETSHAVESRSWLDCVCCHLFSQEPESQVHSPHQAIPRATEEMGDFANTKEANTEPVPETTPTPVESKDTVTPASEEGAVQNTQVVAIQPVPTQDSMEEVHANTQEDVPSQEEVHADTQLDVPSQEEVHSDTQEDSLSQGTKEEVHTDILENVPSQEEVHDNTQKKVSFQEEVHIDKQEDVPSQEEVHTNIQEDVPSQEQIHSIVQEDVPSEGTKEEVHSNMLEDVTSPFIREISGEVAIALPPEKPNRDIVLMSEDEPSSADDSNMDRSSDPPTILESFREPVIDTLPANNHEATSPTTDDNGTNNTPIVSIAQLNAYSITNARYRLDQIPTPDHSNDDTYFKYCNDQENMRVLGVFDGHDGSNASIFARDYMKEFFMTKYKAVIDSGKSVEEVLNTAFQETESAFFDKIKSFIARKKEISQKLVGLTSYEAYVSHPYLVSELQELEPSLSGGTTAVVVVIMEDTLYVANTGDSRAVLVQELDGNLVGKQLTEDHTVENDQELDRLERLGLDPTTLKKNGRLGTQENTRCIGDYQIKEGYKEVETISHALEPPGIAIPTVTRIKVPSGAHYLLLMTDGVYKSIENMFDSIPTSEAITTESLISRMLEAELNEGLKEEISKCVLLQLEDDHHKTFQECMKVSAKQSVAQQCRKRDDMTLMVCQFHNHTFESILKAFKLSKPVVADVIKPKYIGHSYFSIENERYQPGGTSSSDHSNDDRYFNYTHQDRFKSFGVFDGHDGSNASIYASKCMEMFLNRSRINSTAELDALLVEMFSETDNSFFESKKDAISRKKRITQKLQGLTSYEAYMRHPALVSELQELEPSLSGGTTAVVVVIMEDTLYVANTGDSRAVLVQELDDGRGTLVGTQLTEDHTVDNEEEVSRLESLGLDPVELKRTGRLGTQENTRCIGDYQIKEGYKEVETISCATQPPGIAIPYIRKVANMTGQYKYLLLMTDGVYKSIENMYHEPSPSDIMEKLVARLAEAVKDGGMEGISQRMLLKIKSNHKHSYLQHASTDRTSPIATQCRKRDDMTLTVILL